MIYSFVESDCGSWVLETQWKYCAWFWTLTVFVISVLIVMLNKMNEWRSNQMSNSVIASYIKGRSSQVPPHCGVGWSRAPSRWRRRGGGITVGIWFKPITLTNKVGGWHSDGAAACPMQPDSWPATQWERRTTGCWGGMLLWSSSWSWLLSELQRLKEIKTLMHN